ncbi:cell division protein FtsB [Deinococcus radiodurans]|nr:cell division protein FtsB [Deinococcus radiodurans]UID71257.1 cell division protein FtsB [Deinococcus radiodurans R1 = ATCC 13939 = DSM 20539]
MDASPSPAPSAHRTWRETWRLRSRQLRRLPLTMMITCLLLLLGSVQAAFQIGNNVYRSWTWTQETEQVRGRVAALQSDLHMLKDAEAAAQDPAYLQILARCQGFVRVGETVVVASGAPSTPPETCDSRRLP